MNPLDCASFGLTLTLKRSSALAGRRLGSHDGLFTIGITSGLDVLSAPDALDVPVVVEREKKEERDGCSGCAARRLRTPPIQDCFKTDPLELSLEIAGPFRPWTLNQRLRNPNYKLLTMLSILQHLLFFPAAVSVTAFTHQTAPQPAGYPSLPHQICAQTPHNLPDGGVFRPAEQGHCKQTTIEVCASKKCARIAANGGTELCLERCIDEGPGDTECTNQGLLSWQNGCQLKAGGPSVDPWNVPYPGPADRRVGACTTNKDFPCVLTRDMNYVP
ncbi:hypothetical protein BKA80DRAFT_77730 [Phyllosticta citrichinensis]